MPVAQRKRDIVTKLCQCFTDYKQIIVVKLDNVSTNQIHKARNLLRTAEFKGHMIIGKNTLIKKALKFMTEEPVEGSLDYEDHKQWTQDPKLDILKQYMVLNVGLIFTNAPYSDIKPLIEAEIIKQPARTGVVAPTDVWVPAGPTGLQTGLIDLFHKLNISCKTVKSAIEIVKEVKIITKGEKVGEGATQMCKLLNIIPFEYSLNFDYVYLDGCVLDSAIIEMKPEVITDKFKEFAGHLTALSLGANIPNELSVPHMIGNCFKNLLAIGSESGYSFKALEDALTASANAPTQTVAAVATDDKKAEAAKVEEPEEEEEDMDIGDLFG